MKTLFFLVLSLGLLLESQTEIYPYVAVIGSSEFVKMEEICFSLVIWDRAGEFFDNLEHLRTGSADRFRKNGEFVSVYPSNIVVSVGFMPLPCTGSIKRGRMEFLSRRILNSFQLKSEWKTGVELRPADLETLPQLFEDSASEREPSNWRYDLHVRAKGVPLTDEFVVSVLDSQGKLLGRAKIDLTTDLKPPPFPLRRR